MSADHPDAAAAGVSPTMTAIGAISPLVANRQRRAINREALLFLQDCFALLAISASGAGHGKGRDNLDERL